MITATVLVRLPVDINLDQPGEAAARTLRNIIVHGIDALTGEVPDWRAELDEESGIITLRPATQRSSRGAIP